jgi:hypothetical protein
MKIITETQNDHAWVLARLGLPTASQADRLLTPKTRKPSGGRFRYRAELLAEWLLGQRLEDGTSSWMERGTEMEDEARNYYALQGDVDVEQVGFCVRDDGKAGCSPDGLVLSDGLLEIKCPSALVHVSYMLGDSPDYLGQCQMQLYIMERAFVDVLSYNPDLPPVINRVPRNEEYIKALVPVLDDFLETLDKEKERLAEHKVTRPWDLEREVDTQITRLRDLVARAEGVDVELMSFTEREGIEKAIEARNPKAIGEWIEDLVGLPWEKFDDSEVPA